LGSLLDNTQSTSTTLSQKVTPLFFNKTTALQQVLAALSKHTTSSCYAPEAALQQSWGTAAMQ
jgi:hypothetical protein